MRDTWSDPREWIGKEKNSLSFSSLRRAKHWNSSCYQKRTLFSNSSSRARPRLNWKSLRNSVAAALSNKYIVLSPVFTVWRRIFIDIAWLPAKLKQKSKLCRLSLPPLLHSLLAFFFSSSRSHRAERRSTLAKALGVWQKLWRFLWSSLLLSQVEFESFFFFFYSALVGALFLSLSSVDAVISESWEEIRCVFLVEGTQPWHSVLMEKLF